MFFRRSLFLPFLFILAFTIAPPSGAVDETAAELIAFGQIRLGEINDSVTKQYPKTKGVFWNIQGDAYHDFSGAHRTDVIIGLAGYKDIGVVYNTGRQMVEDAGAGFAYYHEKEGDWELAQVELVGCKKYEGFEGADLRGKGMDDLVIYSSSGTTQVADIFNFNDTPKGPRFTWAAAVTGYSAGPRVVHTSGAVTLVDYQRAMIKGGDEFQIYYSRPFRFKDGQFQLEENGFLDRVAIYDALHSTLPTSADDLAFFEKYYQDHPQQFCPLAVCYDLSRRLGLKDKAALYRAKLLKTKDKPLTSKCDDPWINDKNLNAKQLYMEWLVSRKD